MQGCCSTDCKDIIQLPYEEQKRIRSGKPAGNRKFKKGRSPVLKFKQQESMSKFREV
jgi:UPF0176 protein